MIKKWTTLSGDGRYNYKKNPRQAVSQLRCCREKEVLLKGRVFRESRFIQCLLPRWQTLCHWMRKNSCVSYRCYKIKVPVRNAMVTRSCKWQRRGNQVKYLKLRHHRSRSCRTREWIWQLGNNA